MKGDYGLFCGKCRFWTHYADGHSECVYPKECRADSAYKNEELYWRKEEKRY